MKQPDKLPRLVIDFGQPLSGYWDGGLKRGGSFVPIKYRNGLVEWGCYELNFWFTKDFGGSWKKALEKARYYLHKITRYPIKTKTVWE